MDLQHSYDENLSQNKFFQKLQTEHKILIETAPLENWIICVPRAVTITKDNLSNTDYLLAHILIPHDEVPEQYTNLLGVDIKQIDGKLCSRGISSRILFEELFYTKGLVKYKVWCVELALVAGDLGNGDGNNALLDGERDEPAGLLIVRDLNDAIDIIWKETNSKTVFRKIENICCSFMKNTTHTRVGNISAADKTIDRLHNSVDILLNHCYKKLLYQKRLSEKCSADHHFAKIIRIALETYMMSILYGWIFDAISVSFAEQNERFNKILRNAADVNQSYFKIDTKYNDVIGRVRSELVKIEDYPTAIEKLSCLRHAFTAASSCKHNDISVDDLIPIVVFVIVKSNLTHWMSTLQFLKKFMFTEVTDGFDKGADSFLVTTLEAAIHYISSLHMTFNTLAVEQLTTENTESSERRRQFTSKEDFVTYLFDRIKAEDEIEIIKLLKTDRDIEIRANSTSYRSDDELGSNDSGNDTDADSRKCSGSSCSSSCTLSTCRLNIQNAHGIGAVHITAMYGLAKMLNVLLALEVDAQITDDNNYTALHYAAARGHQNTLLLLLHAGVDINAVTNEKYTPLHLCCLNGHENCVKALLYYSDHMRISMNRNAQNRMGDTPLHLAAKWGFTNIVETLLEYGVKTDVCNRLGHTVHDYTHNSHIMTMLQNVFVIIEHAETEESATTDANIAVAHSSSGASGSEVYRGFLFADKNHNHEHTATATASIKTSNDKIVAAIRNNDTKLASYFLGLEIADEPETTSCHPLCVCKKCAHINHVQAQQSRIQEQNGGVAAHYYTGNIHEPSAIDGMTPLHAAVRSTKLDLIEQCFKLGAEVATPSTTTKQSSLHYAVLSECYETLELIMNHISDDSDDVNLQDADGNTALHLAVRVGQTKLVECLLVHEPKLDLVNANGQSALDIAKSTLNFNIMQLLERLHSSID